LIYGLVLFSNVQEIKPVVKDDEKAMKTCKEEVVNVENEKAKSLAAEEAQSQTPVVARKERNIDLQVDLEKTDRDSGTASVSGNNKFHHHVQKQQPQHGSTERTGISTRSFFSLLSFGKILLAELSFLF
jgi:hypothetical protein